MRKDIQDKPHWLELPEEEKQKHTYWTTTGTDKPESLGERLKNSLRRKKLSFWASCCTSKEEAEAHASSVDGECWVWDRQPATPITLQGMIDRARRKGRKGVLVRGWRNGRWEILKTYMAGEPLQGEDL